MKAFVGILFIAALAGGGAYYYLNYMQGGTTELSPPVKTMLEDLPSNTLGGIAIENPKELGDWVLEGLSKIPDFQEERLEIEEDTTEHLGFNLLDLEAAQTHTGIDLSKSGWISLLNFQKIETDWGDYTQPVIAFKASLRDAAQFEKFLGMTAREEDFQRSEEGGVTYLSPDENVCFAIKEGELFFINDPVGNDAFREMRIFLQTPGKLSSSDASKGLPNLSQMGKSNLLVDIIGFLESSGDEIPEDVLVMFEGVKSLSVGSNYNSLEVFVDQPVDVVRGSGSFDHFNYLPTPILSYTVSLKNLYTLIRAEVDKQPEENQQQFNSSLMMMGMFGVTEDLLKGVLDDINLSVCLFPNDRPGIPIKMIGALEGPGVGAMREILDMGITMSGGEMETRSIAGTDMYVREDEFGGPSVAVGMHKNTLYFGADAEDLLSNVFTRTGGGWKYAIDRKSMSSVSVDYDALRNAMVASLEDSYSIREYEREIKPTLEVIEHFLGNSVAVYPKSKGYQVLFSRK